MITVTPAAASAQSRRNELLAEQHDTINFGDIPDAINDILQEGVAAYRRDKKRADELFRKALAAAPTELPVYYCTLQDPHLPGQSRRRAGDGRRRP